MAKESKLPKIDVQKGFETIKKKEPKVIKEFKEFINRGSVIDLAVGIIIGGAFTSIVTSLVNDVVMPVISMIIGGFDFTSLKVTIPAYIEGIEPATINYGNFIQALVNFLIIAFVIFLLVRFINKAKEKAAPAPVEDKKAEKAAKEAKESAEETTVLLKEIRDLLKAGSKPAKKS
ncbi:large-conductance mechanosensitive channel protein MscL [Candidatus Saccharibacteria bacterium]|nr:large-conductance mechanosensitive channel protein MscL [Candidatus Saccharibacteria bacterium]